MSNTFFWLFLGAPCRKSFVEFSNRLKSGVATGLRSNTFDGCPNKLIVVFGAAVAWKIAIASRRKKVPGFDRRKHKSLGPRSPYTQKPKLKLNRG
jgi:hypothetical protein